MEKEMSIGKGINKIGIAIICVGLAFIAVKYDSQICGLGSLLAYLSS